ncbi:MAG: peptidase domain-containing ABC transporter [Allosphingosinicella sp.]
MEINDVECAFARAGSVPQIQQSEAAECGLVCLNMIASAYGQRTDLATLRRRFSLSLKGLTLRSLIEIAGQMGFASRPVRFELDDIDQLSLPCILHWDLSHFVVLVAANRRRIVVHDPASGRSSYSLAAASDHITGVALEVTPSATFKPETTPQKLRISDFWSRSQGFGKSLLHVGACVVLVELCSVVYPFVSQLVVDSAIANGDIGLIGVILLAFLSLLLLRGATTLVRALLMVRLSTSISYQMEVNLFKHLIRLPTPFFERRHVGDIVSRFESVAHLQRFITGDAVTLIIDSILAVLTLIILFLYSPLLVAVSAGCLLLSLAARFALLPLVRNLTTQQIHSGAREQSVFLETVRAQRAIKIFGRENERTAVWQNAVVDNINGGVAMARVGAYSEFLQGTIGGVEALAVLGVGAAMVVKGDLTLGMLFAFQAYSSQFSSRTNSVIDIYLQWRLLGLHKARLADISRAPEERGLSAPRTNEAPKIESVTLSDVRFRYSPYEPQILDMVDLEIRCGETVVIGGPSGSGKSTLLKMVLGLLTPSEGRVLVNGNPLISHGLSDYRAALGVVMQDDTLLSGTIVDNISFFAAEVDMAKIEEAARLACVHDDIMRLPMGYQSFVGDMGSVLSGGQKQRVLLARALYRDPQIIVLDEGTANLDHETETRVLANLAGLPAIKLIITHGHLANTVATRRLRLVGGKIHEVAGARPELEEAA